ncbi:MAG TPA: hypothetical protein VIX59_12085 [Candidatus Binataceae bacterium]
MSKRGKGTAAAIGFRVKTGRATAIVVAGTVAAPQILRRVAVQLCDPAFPESFQPYHAALELPEPEGAAVLKRATAAVQALATRAIADLAEPLRDSGLRLRGIGLVVASDHDPGPLGHSHVRAHALEGRLFWKVMEHGSDSLGLPHLYILERDAFEAATVALGRKPDDLKRIVMEMGRAVGRPWSAEEKTATLAAWMALAG